MEHIQFLLMRNCWLLQAACLDQQSFSLFQLIKMSSERYFFNILTGNTLVKTNRGRADPVFCPSQGKSRDVFLFWTSDVLMVQMLWRWSPRLLQLSCGLLETFCSSLTQNANEQSLLDEYSAATVGQKRPKKLILDHPHVADCSWVSTEAIISATAPVSTSLSSSPKSYGIA